SANNTPAVFTPAPAGPEKPIVKFILLSPLKNKKNLTYIYIVFLPICNDKPRKKLPPLISGFS
ncbi:MAG: hypothetical protein LBG52_01090, partial [Candidatus Peribacteria bacterium]|nr:hypothetical protein [Candidatus Peribacteria bacterium]